MSRPRPLAIAHRGASAREVENSLAAFRMARSLGADAVELDIHSTVDGALVVHHDEMIGKHHVAHCALREIRDHRLANGEAVPILADALANIVPAMIAFVEVKSLAPRWDANLFAAIDGSGHADKVQLHSFDHRIIRRLGTTRPDIARGVLSASYPVRPVRLMEDADASALWQHEQLIDEALVAAVHEAQGAVYAWTVDDPLEMTHLLQLGVDGLCSNHPERAKSAVDSLAS